MPEFLICEHPDLPGQTARLARSALASLPGWTPVDSKPRRPARIKRTDPDAGESTTSTTSTIEE